MDVGNMQHTHAHTHISIDESVHFKMLKSFHDNLL